MKPKVLLIEDEALLTRMYSKKLESDNYECFIAENGLEGLKIAQEKLPDIILCDIMMPVKDGITTLKELKENETTKGIPVIMLTNLSDEKYVEETLELGAVSYLVKSQLVPADVVKKVKEVLEAHGKKVLTN
jgi:DNA-binding response OmpR family regulator